MNTEQLKAKFDLWADSKGLYLSDRSMYWQAYQAAHAEFMESLPEHDAEVAREAIKRDKFESILIC